MFYPLAIQDSRRSILAGEKKLEKDRYSDTPRSDVYESQMMINVNYLREFTTNTIWRIRYLGVEGSKSI